MLATFLRRSYWHVHLADIRRWPLISPLPHPLLASVRRNRPAPGVGHSLSGAAKLLTPPIGPREWLRHTRGTCNATPHGPSQTHADN